MSESPERTQRAALIAAFALLTAGCGAARPADSSALAPLPRQQRPAPAIERLTNLAAPPQSFYLATDARQPAKERCRSDPNWLGVPNVNSVGAPYGPVSYCTYTWRGPLDGRRDPNQLRELTGGDPNLRADVPAVVPLDAEAMHGMPDADLGHAFRLQRRATMLERAGVGTLSGLDVVDHPAVRDAEGRQRVYVAVVDSAADTAGKLEDQLGHGTAVGLVVKELVCRSPSICDRVTIAHFPALDLVTVPARGKDQFALSRSEGGGRYGTQGRLAQAIETATNTWLQRTPEEERLVINLSVGWSGCWNDSSRLVRIRRARQALGEGVYDAILRASCLGALVVVSAGNVEAIPGCPPGASWRGTDPAPRAFPAQYLRDLGWTPSDAAEVRKQRCERFRDEPRARQDTRVSWGDGPLMLAVSAVDEHDAKLSVAAQETNLVAFGGTTAASFRAPAAEAPLTTPLGGTSVSAAVVSGVAAAVWSAHPDFTPGKLQSRLLDSAERLRTLPPGTPTLCNPASTPGCADVARVSLCRAQAERADACGKLPAVPPALDLPPTVVVPTASPACNVGGSSPRCASPSGIDATEQPWAIVGPQPDGRSCGTCGIRKPTSPRRFEGTIDPDRITRGLWNGTVEFTSDPGRRYVLWEGRLAPSASTIERSLCDAPRGANSALVRYGAGNDPAHLVYSTQHVPVEADDASATTSTACAP